MLRVGDDLGDLREDGRLARGLHQHIEDPRPVDGAADDAAAGLLGDGHRLTGQQRFVNGRDASEHHAVGGNLRAGDDLDHVLGPELAEGQLDRLLVSGFPAAAQSQGGGRGEGEELGDSPRGAPLGERLEHLTEQDEGDEHRRRLKDLRGD